MQYQISGYGVRLDDFLNDHKIINKFSEARDYPTDKPDDKYYYNFVYQFTRYLKQHAEHFSATITNENM